MPDVILTLRGCKSSETGSALRAVAARPWFLPSRGHESLYVTLGTCSTCVMLFLDVARMQTKGICAFTQVHLLPAAGGSLVAGRGGAKLEPTWGQWN